MKLTKQDIDKVRNIEGFPIGSDEDIIELSKPPYYTACPNPFIQEFISEKGKVYNEEIDDYSIEPLAEDVVEDKHDLIYNIHTYHTKVPPKAIARYIEHYTDPGDIVLDCFCGSGMTGIASQICDNGRYRRAILCDISSYAAFITSNYNTPNYEGLISELKDIIDEIKSEYGHYYMTNHSEYNMDLFNILDDAPKGVINYVVWSNVYYCPNCGYEMVYYDIAVDKLTNKAIKVFKCGKCNLELEKKKLVPKMKSDFDYDLDMQVETIEKVPVLINYTYNKKRYNKVPDEQDLRIIDEIKSLKKPYITKNKIICGDETDRLFREGITHVKLLYNERTLFFISLYLQKIKNDNKKMFLLTSALSKLTILNRFMPEHGSRALVGPRTGTYYLPPLCVENDVIGQLEFQLAKLKNLNYKSGEVMVSNQSATDLSNVPDNSIDYIFIDPPFGSNIMYSELNLVPESWLSIRTNNLQEAIMNKSQHKNLDNYKDLIERSFKELFRVLKPNRWITVEFHNSKNSIWNAIQDSLGGAGFVIADVRVLNKKKKTINQSTLYGCVDQDLVISAYKPKESFIRKMIDMSGTEETAWNFIYEHLRKLPVIIQKDNEIEIVKEREPFLLFDRMIAYHIMNGIAVPIDAVDFYKGLDERFIKRDGMYFLHNQVNEYDNVRIVSKLENMQLSFIITDEKHAIQWLYKELSNPQSYSELQPKFIQELRTVKYEKMPELMQLLEENFLQDNDGRWYIPDPTKSGDIVKLREKRLIKEFEEYLNGKGRLKTFRTEAIRVGFAKLWRQKEYSNIVKVANRLPDSVIQEDDKLLMYYDISLSRIE
ncbi:DNA methyltransferase [Clostridium tertium]|uniref:DNA methyltransferase n=1 Tax=Clostridium tertium TaxID=1559 RepID=UPI00325C05C8